MLNFKPVKLAALVLFLWLFSIDSNSTGLILGGTQKSGFEKADMTGNDIVSKAERLDKKFHRIVAKIKQIEKVPRGFGTVSALYTSEIHTIREIGMNPGINLTTLAKKQGITRGAVSQVITKLVKKKLVIRMKEIGNEKSVFLKLSDQGITAFQGHQKFYSQLHAPVISFLQNASDDNFVFMESFLSVMEDVCDRALL